MITQRFLTKSRFKLGRECPTKLFYTGKKDLYPDNKLDDAFLEALANGGYQVGELAKQYFPGGHEVSSLDYDIALSETSQLLEQENIIIYEAAVRYQNLFIRADILVKTGNTIRIIEVKAKSSDGKGTQQFMGIQVPIKKNWIPYLEDIAFQKYVVQKAFPERNVTGSLMLADKSSACPTSGLNQKFKVTKDDNRRKGVLVSATLNQRDLSSPILVEIAVDSFIEMIYRGEATKEKPAISFMGSIKELSVAYQQGKKLTPVLSRTCKSCEFTCTPEQEKSGKKSGFKECWAEQTGLTSDDLSKALVTELWNGNLKKLLEAGVYQLRDIYPDILEEKIDDNKPGLSRSQRQWLQINKVKNNDQDIYFDKEGLSSEMASWSYPLHFIDFETSATAIPFNAGRSPYEQVAFQFSHHIMLESGKVEHKGQFINTTPGEFPNYQFMRALKQQLENDNGTVFRYHNHENTILCSILDQLQTDPNAPADTEELCEFIKSITHPKHDSREQWESQRDMVDLQQMVLRYYFDPETKGSNSIKAILPSVLNRSEYLQNKYSEPVYKNDELTSLNFPEDHRWVNSSGGRVSDPYKSLEPVFDNLDMEQLDLISDGQELRDGGAALTAYGVLQFSEMSAVEREKLNVALLRYCELDTLAMVMIFEAWRDWVN
ncbi:MAG: DUF2779 domain-containing protein [Gammaproteobacteria bacterium]|nr:DUF2779 domain-containing protein [Gammaproteobacteria bacterium]